MYQNNESNRNNRRVAIYARVSTEHDAQLSALENQIDWYTPLLEQHPEWTVIRTYIDEGITGTSAKKRPQFMQMINDAEQGEFDLVLTREVARFARNTVDTLQYTRQLKEHGVEVYFINDNIKTFDGDGELRLTIMATLAQDESRKTSLRVKCGQQTSMKNGVLYGNGNILGYDRVGKELIINPEQAQTVRMIFDWYLHGLGMRAIKFQLEQQGRLTATGKSIWYEPTISHILHNSFYCGKIVYHKMFTPSFLDQKKINNFGEVEQFTVQGTHEPIITESEFEQVQAMMDTKRRNISNICAGRRKTVGQKRSSDLWCQLLQCECGHRFARYTWHKYKGYVQYGYQCYSSVRTGSVLTRQRKGLSTENICSVPMISGWKLKLMATVIFKEFLTNTPQIISLAESMLEKHIDDKPPLIDNSTTKKQKQAEINKLQQRLQNLVEMRADGEITREMFITMKQEVENKLEKLQYDIKSLTPTETPQDNMSHTERLHVLKEQLEQFVMPNETDNIDDNIIKAFITKVVVHKNSFDWYLRFHNDTPPIELSVIGKRRNQAQISSVCSQQHRQLLTIRGNNKFVKIQELEVSLAQAKEYIRQALDMKKINKWEAMRINVYI